MHSVNGSMYAANTYKIGEPIVDGIDVIFRVLFGDFAEFTADVVNVVAYGTTQFSRLNDVSV